MLDYISRFDTYFTIITLYYLFSTAFYLLMWFFKRPTDNFIKKYSLNLKLQVCYWFGFGLMYLQYYFLSVGVYPRHPEMLYILQGIGVVAYIILVLFPVIELIRSKIPDMRG